MHAQAANRLSAGEGGKNTDVVMRRFFPLDIDTIRPNRRVAASNSELAAAQPVFDAVRADLEKRGIGYIPGLSGNGRHLLVPTIDYLPDQSRDEKNGGFALLLRWFSRQFSDKKAAEVDVGNFDPARVWKCYGTAAVKGGNTVERPWRTATFEVSGTALVPVDILEVYKAEIHEQRELELKRQSNRPSSNRRQSGLDIVGLFKEKGLYLG